MKVRKLITIFLFIATLLLFVLVLYTGYYKFYKVPTPVNIESSIDNNVIKVSYDINKSQTKNDIYCIIKDNEELPSVDDKDWTLATNNECNYTIEDKIYKVYLKNENDEIFFVDDSDKLGNITKLTLNKEKIYLALNDTYSPTLLIESVGNADKTVTWTSSNPEAVSVDSSTGKIKTLKKANVTITATVMDKSVSMEVVSTNLIVKAPKKYNSNKSYLPCGKYSEKENNLLDEILKDRINDAGYKTRAGTVAAARFLALEFPYKIRYFSENGRGSTNGVDGEGRYYHLGLYLDESRYKNIKKKANGPKTWGCQLYSGPSHGLRSNGFDCSGFVSWVMLNGGFDVGDIGAGLAPHLDLTDYGKRTKFNADVVKSGKVKVGDLLSSGGVNGGHIAIIVGEDKDYYYVAESLWTPPNVAVVIIGYSKKTIFNRYYYVMLMDSYYKEDGNLTKLWY